MADFLVHQVLRDDPDDFTASSQRGIGDNSHQTHGATAVDQGQFTFGQGPAKGDGGFGVGRNSAGVGTAKYTHGFQRHAFLLGQSVTG
ncbi:hypothetical protein D3C78_1451760 [compost metagenome]